jgi:(p)ppGpp synthase/HD superfamily hydrolase
MKDRIFKRALKFVQKMHKGQFRAGKVPVWQHLLRVSETLAHVLSHTKEGTPAQRQIISIAALGHDLLEDTKATKAQIKNIFGERGFSLIEGMTNVHGDSNHAPYIRAMKGASEEVRLIKLADLYDNVSSRNRTGELACELAIIVCVSFARLTNTENRPLTYTQRRVQPVEYVCEGGKSERPREDTR